jgi:hypothetical protein
MGKKSWSVGMEEEREEIKNEFFRYTFISRRRRRCVHEYMYVH